MKKNRQAPEKDKQPRLKMRIAIFMMAILFGMLLAYFLHLYNRSGEEQETKKHKPKAGTYTERNLPEIKFRRDGTLRFESPNGEFRSEIEIEIVATEFSRTRGLMFRKQMQENRGMLFIFSSEIERSFWMRNTYIPLDIIYVDTAGNIVHIAKNTKPLNEDMIPSEGPSRYVVEVNAGYTDMYGIKPGDTITWQED